MKFIRNLLVFVFLCAVVLLGLSFAVQNTTAVPLDLLFVQLPERSVALWIFLAFATGGVIGMLTNIGLVLRLRTSLMQARRKLRAEQKASVTGKAAAEEATPEEATLEEAAPKEVAPEETALTVAPAGTKQA